MMRAWRAVSLLWAFFLVSVAASAKGLVVFGPKVFERSAGPPRTDTVNFSVADSTGSFILRVENGDGSGKNRVSSATIILNGKQIFGPRDFNQNVAVRESQVALSQQNNLAVRLESAPGGFITVTIIDPTPVVIRVIWPVAGQTINARTATIAGEILHSVVDRIGINDDPFVAAWISGSKFYFNEYPLQVGTNEIKLKALDRDGELLQEVKLTVLSSQDTSPRLIAEPRGGVAPLQVSFKVIKEAKSLLDPELFARYVIDFDGDGVNDLATDDPKALVYRYQSEGLYLAKITVADAAGNQFSDTTAVDVYSPRMFAALWDGMRSALLNGDVESALSFFREESRAEYRLIFNALGGELKSLASLMQTGNQIELIYAYEARVKCRLVRRQNVQGVDQDITYYLYFARGQDGRWKIDQF